MQDSAQNKGSGLAFRLYSLHDPLMSGPLRIEFPGAIYHVASRGDRREPVYRDDEDRTAQLEIIARVMDRFDAEVLAPGPMPSMRLRR